MLATVEINNMNGVLALVFRYFGENCPYRTTHIIQLYKETPKARNPGKNLQTRSVILVKV